MKKILVLATALLSLANPAYAILQPGNPNANLFVDPARTGNNFQAIMLYALTLLMSLVGFVAMVFLVLGAFYYMTSGANEDLAKKGKSMMTKAIIGLVVAILSFVILTVVQNAVRGTV